MSYLPNAGVPVYAGYAPAAFGAAVPALEEQPVHAVTEAAAAPSADLKPPFAVLIPGRPMITDLVALDEARMVCTVPEPDGITQLAVSANVPVPDGTGISVYYAGPDGAEWNYLGHITPAAPTAFFRAPWNGTGVLPTGSPCVHIMLSLESARDIADKVTADQVEEARSLDSVRGIAQDLYTYMTSYAQPADRAAAAMSTDVMIIPTNFIDRWIGKFSEKHRKQPFFWMNARKE
jgi:hypothetical protein